MSEKEQLELEKLRAEIDALRASVPSTAERESQQQLLEYQVGAERQKIYPTLGAQAKEWVQLLAGFIPLIAVIVAFFTLLHDQRSDSRQFERAQRATIAELGQGLSHANAATRVARANALASFLRDPSYTDIVATMMISAVLEERELRVRGAFLQVIALEPAAALRNWRETRVYAWSSLEELRRRRVELRKKPAQDANAAEHRELADRITALQHAVVGLAHATRNSQDPADCAKVKGCAHCRMNLQDLYLDDFDFFASGYTFCNVDLSGAHLRSANFTGLDLTAATFARAGLQEAHFRNATLVGVDFSDANMAWKREGSGHRPLADFKGADVSGASFDRACLSGASFNGIRDGLEAKQLSKAYAAGARFDRQIGEALEAAGAIKGGPKCQQPH